MPPVEEAFQIDPCLLQDISYSRPRCVVSFLPEDINSRETEELAIQMSCKQGTSANIVSLLAYKFMSAVAVEYGY